MPETYYTSFLHYIQCQAQIYPRRSSTKERNEDTTLYCEGSTQQCMDYMTGILLPTARTLLSFPLSVTTIYQSTVSLPTVLHPLSAHSLPACYLCVLHFFPSIKISSHPKTLQMQILGQILCTICFNSSFTLSCCLTPPPEISLQW